MSKLLDDLDKVDLFKANLSKLKREIKSLEKRFDGRDGRPLFDGDKVVEFIAEHGSPEKPMSPSEAFKAMNPELENFEPRRWEDAEPKQEKVTKENLYRKASEALHGEPYDPNDQSVPSAPSKESAKTERLEAGEEAYGKRQKELGKKIGESFDEQEKSRFSDGVFKESVKQGMSEEKAQAVAAKVTEKHFSEEGGESEAEE